MKTLVRLFLAMLAFVLVGVCETVAADSKESEPEVFPLKKPIPLEYLVGSAGLVPLTAYPLDTWQRKHLDLTFEKAEPIIENDTLTGWKVWSTKTSFFNQGSAFRFFSYIPFRNPFILPESMTAEAMTKEVWPKFVKEFASIGRNTPYNIQAIAMNHIVTADGKTKVFGFWFSFQTPDARVVNGELRTSIGAHNQREYEQFTNQRVDMSMPMPEIVTYNPDLYLAKSLKPADTFAELGIRPPVRYDRNAIAGLEVVMMEPFEVIADKMTGDWRFHYNGIKRSDYMRIANLNQSSPAAKAGLKDGMYVWSINGVNAIGRPMSANTFQEEVFQTVVKDPKAEMRFEVSDTENGTRRFITVPAKPVEKASALAAAP